MIGRAESNVIDEESAASYACYESETNKTVKESKDNNTGMVGEDGDNRHAAAAAEAST